MVDLLFYFLDFKVIIFLLIEIFICLNDYELIILIDDQLINF